METTCENCEGRGDINIGANVCWKCKGSGKVKQQRTISQNRALHLAFTQISTELVGQGIDRKTIVEDLEGYSAPVTPEFLKEVFKTIMYTLFIKTSTTELSVSEMSYCFDVFAKFLSESYGIDVTWPSMDSLAMQALIDSQT